MLRIGPAFNIIMVYKLYLPSYGGIELLMHIIACELIRRGVIVCTATLRLSDLPSFEVVDGVNVCRLGFRWLLFDQVDVGVDVGGLREVLRDADVVHVFSSIPSSLLVSSLRRCRELGKVCVWQPIYIPGRFRYHRSVFVRLIGGLWDRFVLPRLARYAHGLVTLTSAEAEYFRRFRPDLPIEVFGECVEEVSVDRDFVEEVLGRYGLSWGSYVLSVGRLTWYKGYDLLVDAWRFIEKDYPWLKLVIVGSDWGYKRELLARIHKYGLKNVVMLENVPGKELHALYEGSLFVVQLSRFETFHRIALEAWSHRKPIVALDLDAATEHIRDSDDGLLIRNHNDVGEIVSALRRLIEDDSLRASMGLRGYKVFKERYSVPRYVDRLLKFYEMVREAAKA